MDVLKPDAADVGSHCTTCRALDFLPYKCGLCAKAFCKEHADDALPAAHDCTGIRSVATTASHDTDFIPAAGLKDLLPDPNRRATSTATSSIRQQKKQAALDVLRQNFPDLQAFQSSGKGAKQSTLKPIDKKLLVMKMKQRAKPADPKKQAPPQERRYLCVRNVSSATSMDLWLQQDIVCGKALDLFAAIMMVKNTNNLSTALSDDLLFLCLISDESATSETVNFTKLDLTRSIGSQTHDADSVYVVRGSLL